MKNIMCLTFFVTTFAIINAYSQFGIGTNTPSSAAVLDLTSTTKGFLYPRMTASERDAISAPTAGLTIWCSDCGLYGEMVVYNGTSWTNMAGGDASEVLTVKSATNKVWMDRNLGATQRAQSATDYLAYGYLYQWGRRNDGHQLINWTTTSGTGTNIHTTSTLATTDTESNQFVAATSWCSDTNSTNNLWQGVNGTNKPCPAGFRIPTFPELENEFTENNITDSATAYNSILKLPCAGYRDPVTYGYIGNILNNNLNGVYWTSTVSTDTTVAEYTLKSKSKFYNSGVATTVNNLRSYGLSVRCIRDY